MTQRTSFSDAEWALLGDAPMAAVAVALASPGGGRHEAHAMVTGWREAGRLKMEIDTGDLGAKLDRLSTSTDAGLQRLSVGMVLAGMLIGSALGLGFFRLFEGVIWEYIYGLVVLVFVAVLVYSAVVVWMLVRSLRSHSDRS